MTEDSRRRHVLAAIAGCVATVVLVQSVLLSLITGVAIDTSRTNEMCVLYNAAAAVLGNPHRFRMVTSPYYIQPRPTDLYYNHMISHWSNQEYVQHLRVTRSSFDLLLGHLELGLRGQANRFRVPLEPRRKLAIGLYKLAHGADFRAMELLFGVAPSTACKAYQQFIHVTLKTFQAMVCFPGVERFKSIIAEFTARGMVGCAGSIDGTHVACRKPSVEYYEDYYCTRKDDYTLSTQAVCDY